MISGHIESGTEKNYDNGERGNACPENTGKGKERSEMKTRQILFTEPLHAVLQETEVPAMGPEGVLARTEYTVISGGTERANLLGTNNIPGGVEAAKKNWPRKLGYCGIGRVLQTGEKVEGIRPGDRVLIYHGYHADLNVRNQDEITKVEDDLLPSEEAVFAIIAAMGLGGMRRLEVEIGESAMVMGLGLLGIFALKFLSLSGAYPLIAADPDTARRALALRYGADLALDPYQEDFAETVRARTGGHGVRAVVEVTGNAQALDQALRATAREGRISLLGCTRVSDFPIDFYSQVHVPGIKLIGAHNLVRPKKESYPHHWTHQDDVRMILDFMSAGKLDVRPLIARIAKPEQAPDIYRELAESRSFPLATLFDWRD